MNASENKSLETVTKFLLQDISNKDNLEWYATENIVDGNREFTNDINKANRFQLIELALYFDDKNYSIIEEKITRQRVSPKIEINRPSKTRSFNDSDIQRNTHYS